MRVFMRARRGVNTTANPSVTYEIYASKNERFYNNGWELDDSGHGSTDPETGIKIHPQSSTDAIAYDEPMNGDSEHAREISSIIIEPINEIDKGIDQIAVISNVDGNKNYIDFEGTTYLMISPDFTMPGDIFQPDEENYYAYSIGVSLFEGNFFGRILYKPIFRYYKKKQA